MNNPCKNCDSTSMEMCLLIRRCKYWAVRNSDKENSEKEKPQENEDDE